MNLFQSLIYSFSFDIFLVTETWLSSAIYNNELLPSGYTVYRKDRESRGGGVAIFAKSSLSTSLLVNDSTIEGISITLIPNIIITCIYVPPNAPDLYIIHPCFNFFQLSVLIVLTLI